MAGTPTVYPKPRISMLKTIFVFLVALALWSCQPNASQNTPQASTATPANAQAYEPLPKPQKTLNVAFLVVNGVYNSELMAPYDIFHHTVFHTKPGMRVFTVGPDTTLITTFEGIRLKPDFAWNSPNLPAIDVLVVASAEHSMDTDLENQAMMDFVKNTGAKAQYLISLCDGAFVLAKAGFATGKVSTTFPADVERYRQTFPDLEVKEGLSFVHDGNLLTSAGGAISYDVALYLVERLYGQKAARGVAKGLVIDWQLANIAHFVAQP